MGFIEYLILHLFNLSGRRKDHVRQVGVLPLPVTALVKVTAQKGFHFASASRSTSLVWSKEGSCIQLKCVSSPCHCNEMSNSCGRVVWSFEVSS